MLCGYNTLMRFKIEMTCIEVWNLASVPNLERPEFQTPLIKCSIIYSAVEVSM